MLAEFLPKLKGKQFVVMGLRGSGKTFFSNKLAQMTMTAVFDVNNEYETTPNIVRFRVSNSMDFITLQKEADKAIRFVVNNNRVIKMLIIEEANRVFPNKMRLPFMARELVDLGRHYGITIGYITRRPTQLNTDIVELADYMVIFSLKGKNDIQYLEDLRQGLGKEVAHLKKFEYIVADSLMNTTKYLPLKV